MRLVKYKDIDPEKWNACVGRVPKSFFYGLYEYLSVICNWEAIIEEVDGVYLFVVPLPYKSKLLLKYTYQPFFCQQLGVFGLDKLSQEQEQEIFRIIKRNYVLGSSNWSFSPHKSAFLQIDEQPNYELDLSQGWEEIESKFNNNRRRVLKKNRKVTTSISVVNDDQMICDTIDRFQSALGNRFGEIKPAHYKLLKDGFLAIKEQTNIQVFNLSVEGNMIASVLIVEYNDRLIYMLGYVDEGYKKSGINSLLFEEIIKRNTLTDKILDFEGGKNAGIAQFYSSFGAVKQFYCQLTIKTKINEILKIVR